jgi:hypothetical protein
LVEFPFEPVELVPSFLEGVSVDDLATSLALRGVDVCAADPSLIRGALVDRSLAVGPTPSVLFCGAPSMSRSMYSSIARDGTRLSPPIFTDRSSLVRISSKTFRRLTVRISASVQQCFHVGFLLP